VGGLFWIFNGLDHPKLIPFQIVAFGFGASFVALFAQLGGGIYTKAATWARTWSARWKPASRRRSAQPRRDRGPGGDNVGDCAGRGADLFESTAAENIGA